VAFTAIPVLSIASARHGATKLRFLAALRRALLDVGFAYLADLSTLPPQANAVPEEGGAVEVETRGLLDDRLVERVCEQTRLFFDEDVLPREEKERIEMKNQPSFLGWSRVSLSWYLPLNCVSSLDLRDS